MKLLHEIIKDYAIGHPEKSAVTDSYGSVSYEELCKISAATAFKLNGFGVKPGDTVAIYVPYIKEILPAIISVLRAGCIFVPFDDEYPVNRLEYMLSDSEAAAILTTRKLWQEKGLGFPEDKVIYMDEVNASDGSYDCPVPLTLDSPAMLLYTSGTTGNPKGVLHTHNMLVHLSDYIKVNEEATMDEATRCGILSSFPFIATQTFLLGPMASGGTVCVVPEEVKRDMGYLYNYIMEEKITHIFLPSSLAAILSEDYDTSGIYVFNGGEKLRNFRPCVKGSYLVNSYGCTEIGGALSKKVFGNEERILVGKPYSNTKTRIIDENLNNVPDGETGELIVSNDFMSRSYYKLPELSREKWIELDGDIWFRTGDRALYMPNGDIDLLGRMDNMVKLRGFRIETGEVETQIANAILKTDRTDIGQLVVVVKSVGGTEHLCCYYEAEKDIDENSIKEEVSKYLAPYMVPDIWVRMDALPTNTNGKVMRKELPQPKRKGLIDGALDSEVLARLIYTAEDVLDVDSFIGAGDRFTDIGGTSLSAMQYAALLREQGIKISGSDILSSKDFRDIADKAEVSYEQLWSAEEYAMIHSEFAERGEHIEKVLPISSQQDDMLFRQLLYPECCDYLNVLMLQVESTVSEEQLHNALDIIADENEELRSALVFRGVSVIQQVITDRRIPLEMIEEDDFGKEERNRLREGFIHEHFDPQYSSMMKVVCVHANVHEKRMSFLYFLTYDIAVEQIQLKKYVRRLMEILADEYPEDASIRDWIYLTEEDFYSEDADENVSTGKNESKTAIRKKAPDIRVYSENKGPKMVFIHTANTGSDAYYRMADRIRDDISFAVIEPYNLYHPDKACYGIKNIATNYIRILKEYQPEGPYIIGGWCYGGIVAHEMACQLERAGEKVSKLFMLDSHAISNNKLRKESKGMFSEVSREYFETCPLFAELRANGMLDALIDNSAHVYYDLQHLKPSFYHGDVIYFKPDEIPAGVSGLSYKYWKDMMEYEAGNFENYCSRDKLKIIHTPHEHDLMMDDQSLDIIIPEIYKAIGI